MVYADLPGRSLDVDTLRAGPGLASRLGQVIAQVHELDTAIIADAGLPVYDAQSYQARRLAELDETARTGHVPAGLLRRWEAALEDVRLWRFRATVVHGDLAAEHILVADEEISALLDWAEARVADPADDLAWLLAAATEEAGETILSAYTTARTDTSDQFLADRALLASELALARWLMHGVRQRDDEVVADAVQMLHDLDAAVADGPPIGYTKPATAPAPADAGAGMAGGSAPDDTGEVPQFDGLEPADQVDEAEGLDPAGNSSRAAAAATDPARTGVGDDEAEVTAPFPPPTTTDEDVALADAAGTRPDASATAAWNQREAETSDPDATAERADAYGVEAGEDTTEIPAPDLREPDYRRRPGRPGIDDSPTSEFPASQT